MTTKNIVFIDSRVAGYETLIASLGVDTEWYLLDANQDGVEQMQRILGGYTELDSVQVISHGLTGTLYLGSTVLNSDNLAGYESQLQAIGASLTETGDILLYGCNVAQGDVGASFVNSLAQITGADVAASEDATTSSNSYGNLSLEYNAGRIDAASFDFELNGSLGVNLVPDIQSLSFVAGIDSATQLPHLSFNISLSENFSEATSVSLLYWRVNEQQTWITIDRDVATGVFSKEIILPDYAISGDYAIRSLNMVDNTGQNVSLNEYQLTELGFDIVENLANPNSDNASPYLESISASPYYFDLDGDIHIPLEINAADIGSGLESAFVVEFSSPTGASLQQWANFDSSGNAVVDFELPRYSASGEYTLNTVRLHDLAGNNEMSQSWLATNPISINIANPNADNSAPSLTSFTPVAVYDPHTHRPVLVLKGQVDEIGSGLSGVYVRMNSPSGTMIDAPWLSYSQIADGKYKFDGEKALSTEFTPGEYSINYILLQDGAGNREYFYPESLNSPSIKEIIRVYFPLNQGQTDISGSSLDDFVFGSDLTPDHLRGGGGKDYLYSGKGDDTVDAGEGDDEIVGGDGAGNDTYIGGAGIDIVRYTSAVTGITVDLTSGTATGNEIGSDILSEIENIIGGQADDSLKGNGQANNIDGYTGNDTIYGFGGTDTLAGGLGNDTYVVNLTAAGGLEDVVTESGGSGIDTIQLAGASTNTVAVTRALGTGFENLNAYYTGTSLLNLTGNADANILKGNAANNVLTGGAGVDTLYGYAGNDTYVVNLKSTGGLEDTIVETSTVTTEIDTLKLAGASTNTSAFTISLAATSLLNVEHLNASSTGTSLLNLTGNTLANSLTGNSANNVLRGGDGNDTLTGGAGADTLYGDLGIDSLIGGTGNDTYVVNLKSTGALEDYVVETSILSTEIDTLKLTGASTNTTAVTINLVATNLQNLEHLSASSTGTSLLNLTGNTKANSLTGNNANNILRGGDGNDTLTGGAGADTLYGDLGTDSLVGGTGNDTYVVNLKSTGGLEDTVVETSTVTTEIDTLKLAGSSTNTSAVTISLAATSLLNVEHLNASATGTSLLNLTGNTLANSLTGNNANNVLIGGSGNDTLSGGYGDDRLIGGIGKDSLIGGNGNDIFDFNSLAEMGTTSSTWDVISGFTRGQDKIDLSTLDANTATTTNDAFNGTLIASSASFTAAGQLKLVSGVLFGNTDADSTAEFAIQLTGITALSAADFVL